MQETCWNNNNNTVGANFFGCGSDVFFLIFKKETFDNKIYNNNTILKAIPQGCQNDN